MGDTNNYKFRWYIAFRFYLIDFELNTDFLPNHLQSWKKIVGTPWAIYYNYLHTYHYNRKWGMTLLKENSEVIAFIIILLRRHLSIWHWLLTTWLVSTLNWGNGRYFSLESGKMCQHFFSMIVWSKSYIFHLNLFFCDHYFKSELYIFIKFCTYICKYIIFMSIN